MYIFQQLKNLFDKKILNNGPILYLTTDFLYNRKYYIASLHSQYPNRLAENKKKIDQYNNKYNKILLNLYNISISKLKNGNAFQAFNQVALLNKVNITKILVGIEFKGIIPNEKILKYITKNYPDIKIKIT